MGNRKTKPSPEYEVLLCDDSSLMMSDAVEIMEMDLANGRRTPSRCSMYKLGFCFMNTVRAVSCGCVYPRPKVVPLTDI